MWTCGFCRLRSNIVTRGEGVLFFAGEERKIAEYESGCMPYSHKLDMAILIK